MALMGAGEELAHNSAVHPSNDDVGSVTIRTGSNGPMVSVMLYPPLKTTSPGKHVTVELLTRNPEGCIKIGPNSPTSL